ncbi:GntR family transcriptional regulator [Loktanella sp. S4079]|uniref:GntR family transcriptional regulator n=1 Tax=Loktanella sp. S4079 TaxID=579483 RepID=UPI0005FA267E|nr:GntR family transcriptional regulator [Loktanella sp. S4079]KJZ21232.1 GntR family transcriptional regulator [Loktanella sp. S4079]
MPALASLGQMQTTTATDQVFQALYSAIITLELAPGSKVSEAEVARNLGVSRQPVRDAFYRLSELGFMLIRPQRATTITYISEQALLDARFIRTALEVECLRTAIAKIDDADVARLDDLLAQQEEAIEKGDRLGFHALDDQFHEAICDIAGHPKAWNLIHEQKVHLDRVRYLSLAFGAQSALDDHRAIMKCIRDRDADAGEAQLRTHLARILGILEQVRSSHPELMESHQK